MSNYGGSFVRTFQKVVCAVTTIFGGFMMSASHAATIPYVNDFNSEGLPNATGEFTLDAGNGVLNYAVEAGGGVVVSTASEQITDLGTSDFVMSSRFTLNQNDGTSLAISMGFGAFGSASNFTGSYYLADWTITTTSGSAGSLRILAQGDSSDFSREGGDSDGLGENGSSVVTGNTYELKLTGTYTGGTLDLTLAIFDDLGTQLGIAATATDSSPLAGQFFGYRNRTAHASHAIDVSYDNFSVVVPEPASLLLALTGTLGLGGIRRRGSGVKSRLENL